MIKFDSKVKCNSEFVALRVIEDNKILNIGGFVLSESAHANDKLGFYEVVDAGTTAFEKYGLKAGDYVLADRLSTFYKSEPICIMRFNNVIVKTDANRSEYHPLKNMIFVEEDKEEKSESGFFIPNQLKTGKIIDMNIEETDDFKFPFKVGDKVLLTKGADYVSFGNTAVHIYLPDMILCKIED